MAVGNLGEVAAHGPLVYHGLSTHIGIKGIDNFVQEAVMVAGIVLIVAGVLLVIYPPLLSIIVAVFLVAAGSMVISIALYNRKNHRHYENPTVEFFFRY
ncbi:MAG: hypothetical protein WCH04_16415 [Gammaproteobacteria bacterium]